MKKQTPEYKAWSSMHRRCTDKNRHNYHRYGGRGIQICSRWGKFESFLEDMGNRPGAGYSLDRIDNDGNYEPSNCRWATAKEQSNNRSIYAGHHGPRVGSEKSSLALDLSGKKFERLLVLNWLRSDKGRQIWLAMCDCGATCEAQGRQMIRGYKKSCGCLHDEFRSGAAYRSQRALSVVAAERL